MQNYLIYIFNIYSLWAEIFHIHFLFKKSKTFALKKILCLQKKLNTEESFCITSHDMIYQIENNLAIVKFASLSTSENLVDTMVVN